MFDSHTHLDYLEDPASARAELGLTGLVGAEDLFNGFSGNAVMSVIATMILGTSFMSLVRSRVSIRRGCRVPWGVDRGVTRDASWQG